MGCGELLNDEASLAVWYLQWLPAAWIVNGRWRVDRLIPAGIGVGDTRRPVGVIAKLVGAVLMPKIDDRLGGDIADTGRRRRVGGGIGWVIAQAGHEVVKHGLIDREEIDQGTVGRIAHGLILVRHRLFRCRSPKGSTQLSTDCY